MGMSTNIPRKIFPEHYLGIFPENSQGNFSEYSGNTSWECSTNIPQTYICPVGQTLTLWIFTINIKQNHIFLVIGGSLTSDNPSCFRKNLLERI